MKVTITPASVTPEEYEAEDWIADSLKNRLSNSRQVATQWGATLGVITALLGASTVVGAHDVVIAMYDPWPLRFGVATAIALVGAAFAVFAAFVASQRSLVKVPADAGKRVTLLDSLFQKANMWLTVSQVSAAIAVVALIVALGIAWYAPQNKPGEMAYPPPSPSPSASVAT
jgi:hypothetical protein